MRPITYRDVARRIALAETDEKRAVASAVRALYRLIGNESTRERIAILREELQATLKRHRASDIA